MLAAFAISFLGTPTISARIAIGVDSKQPEIEPSPNPPSAGKTPVPDGKSSVPDGNNTSA